MKSKFKKIIQKGLIYGIAFFALSVIICYFSTNIPLKKILIISIPIAILIIIINGFFDTRFTKSLKALEAITVTFQDFEILKLQAPANYIINDHLISGKLFLTDKRLIFKSYEQEEFSWFVDMLHSFLFYRSIINKGGEFIVTDDNDIKLIFEVDEISSWKKALLNNEKSMDKI